MKKIATLLALAAFMGCKAQNTPSTSCCQDVKIKPLTENVYIHISYLNIPGYGTFPSNGLIFFNKKEAIVFDTPVDDNASAQLINWITATQQATIKAVVINHFHDDCLGGLKEFHANGIPSYASNETIRLAKQHNEILPKYGFDNTLELKAGNKTTITRFFGAGHTVDNVVSYIPSEETLFGGCLVKEINAGKGNLADANIQQWPHTIQKIKDHYPQLQYVIPGHGKHGGTELLDYTITLFTTQ
ncbi:subclass B1 metallo-beta-lactamase [Abyssalbus ytuae]|uniref:beta-lactamase n=1 Tax=Abyssalbus ytuae TaxID=2926907 RepID=A0A9E6ZX34_9FLAO|nr:subclass B1 metallo-beta-lactamase [Abyssalbus ytuae]UOB19348.1 subclass B1 metallo-beta-lactamase [Abyssalbus ytuae]